ncbi:TlpA family protein disulfide reductase [Reichenbachiella ulvae]|uniref:TlpA family protein disulfide reductase n=1 Tax=Reichenbachiella ulvae TaxID=2980104 RepID=A0ABT3CZA7_9BACT|nr:TlpA family protein disulfide reductase [Reichenbachiella ulvae]MCV9388849.1 TlpA family protein disulfide reductase [Reichenbachiella ulvae]
MKTVTYLASIVVLSLVISTSQAQNIEVIKYEKLESILNAKTDNNRVINFWATWCGPCVKELPQFEALLEKYKNENLEVILVSMDFASNLEGKVKKFVEKKGLKSKLYLLDETDYNSFIDKIDPSWSGAIPATMMLSARNEKKLFLEKEFKEGELEKAYLDFTK